MPNSGAYLDSTLSLPGKVGGGTVSSILFSVAVLNFGVGESGV